ncbi:hypothetical protein MKW98_001636 [Papaver atlanticum]|uniref:MBD domain-containing protein n=1 Tax=Papaver atlanticum TaxID=357466 RepID=A0AAD4S9R2_9MAGN|nr:hypothetical protein MKW98_001636 [Papaver atlanticum]
MLSNGDCNRFIIKQSLKSRFNPNNRSKNRSIFNKSAGNRKQTYSRLRSLSSSSVKPYNSLTSDPESNENKTRWLPNSSKRFELDRFEKFPAVNSNGVNVDMVELGNLRDPFDSELKKRTIGLDNEVDLLGKKKKIVDASDFGDFLPIGWKLLVSVRRKDGNFSLFCGRYISPNELQFNSCKEVSLYLLSLSEPQDVKQS